MKLTDQKTNSNTTINMYIMSSDGMDKSNDIADDFFGGDDIIVDVDYCIDKVLDWVNALGDFAGADADEKRMAVIDGLLYTNYGL